MLLSVAYYDVEKLIDEILHLINFSNYFIN